MLHPSYLYSSSDSLGDSLGACTVYIIGEIFVLVSSKIRSYSKSAINLIISLLVYSRLYCSLYISMRCLWGLETLLFWHILSGIWHLKKLTNKKEKRYWISASCVDVSEQKFSYERNPLIIGNFWSYKNLSYSSSISHLIVLEILRFVLYVINDIHLILLKNHEYLCDFSTK